LAALFRETANRRIKLTRFARSLSATTLGWLQEGSLEHTADQAPRQILELTATLVPQLLAGDEPQKVVLRQQFAASRIESVEGDGLGFFVALSIPETVPRVEPANIAGADAQIWLVGHEYPMGVVLFVKNGRLALLDFYSEAGDPWTDHDVVDHVDNVVPLYVEPDSSS
jgi:hypothetical protein